MKIQLRDVALEYEAGAPLFPRVSLLVEPGEFLMIEGPSGSGKSSLLRLLNRLQEPTAGEILVDDEPLSRFEVPVLRRRIGYLQQSPVMVEGSVADNLALPFQFAASGASRPPGEAVMRQLLAEFLLEGVDPESDAQRLSVGQKQRVAMIRMLLMRPQVLLCDEPTSALDSESRDIVQESLETLNVEQRMTVVVVTHLAFNPKRVVPRRYRLTRQDGLQAVTG